MNSKGNGTPETCANNLLKLSRGEVSYDRIRGLSTSFIDMNSKLTINEFINDAKSVLEIYEPRIKVDEIKLEKHTNFQGNIYLQIDMSSS